MSKWEWKKLGEVCEFKDSQRKPITANKRVVGPYPYYGATGILDYVEGFLFDEDLVLLGEDGAKWGSGDKSAFLISGKTWVNNHAHVLKPDSSVDYQWLIYYLNFSDLMKYVKGATVPKLNQENAKKILVPIPPLSEQKRIVKFLDEEFSKIDTLKTNAETNLKNAKELFETSLEKELNPPSRHSERSEESSADLPSGWEWKTLGDVCEKISDGSHNPPKGTAANEYKMLSSKNIFNDSLNFDDPRFLTKEEFDLENKRTNVKKGDILLTIVGTIGRCCVFLEDEPVVFQRSVAVLKPNVSLVYSRFLMYGIIALNIEKLGRGAAQKGVYLKQLSNISIPLPPLSVQKEIVARLDKLSESVKRLETNYKQIIANCDELKKSILKKTFEGES